MAIRLRASIWSALRRYLLLPTWSISIYCLALRLVDAMVAHEYVWVDPTGSVLHWQQLPTGAPVRWAPRELA